jgi:paraquat-inducible protein A
MVTFEKFWIFTNTYSLFSGTILLLREGNYFIFAVIFSFSIAFPIFKFIILYQLQLSQEVNDKQKRKLGMLGFVGKWAMLDVFVIAFLVMTIKLHAFGDIKVHFGVYAFTISVILTMITTQIIRKKVDKKGASNPLQPARDIEV